MTIHIDEQLNFGHVLSQNAQALHMRSLEKHMRYDIKEKSFNSIYRKTLLCCLLSVVLIGCATSRSAEYDIRKINRVLNEKDQVLNANLRGGVIEYTRPYYGQATRPVKKPRAVSLSHGKPLPKEFEASLAVTLHIKQPSDFNTIKTALIAVSGLDIISKSVYPTPGGAIDMPIGGRMKVYHRGKLSTLLDRIGSKFDLAWSFDGNTIIFDRMTHLIYDMPLPATSGNITTTLAGINIGGSSITSTKSVSFDAWKELEIALNTTAPPPAQITLSKNAGQVTVFAPPSVQKNVRGVIDRFTKVYSTRIGLEIATYFVDADKSEDFGLGITIASTNGRGRINLGTAISDGVTGGIGIVGGRFGGSQIDFKALAKDTDVVDYRRTDTIAQNGVISPVVLLNTRNFVKETSRETDANGNVTNSVVTDQISTGLSVYALPRLLENGDIQLSLWILQASLNELERFDTGSGVVQLPNTDQRAIEYTLVMKAGETLIMGGYEQQTATKARSGAGNAGFFGLGGSRTAKTRRTKMIVMVRPSVVR